ncbi:ATP-grasp domain-containing protein [Mesorhizobium ventifaucium]|uniref:ATP-dependent carboxylate-amine ligase domain protein ATP-grasp n=1 Tax=Mesorhizobium ventifaucium TaxID=666020 RepID=A0ABN8J8C9_9HYPH|nr:acetyl-CoA carboxylase biotin carboxylase subunit family protein [Mesorhizobium ventifaucium]CAH2394390.1 ATP-dependent carboxylate-amine ligase domain protein ATP-grasp [Mesorhizobium ventifaucium]
MARKALILVEATSSNGLLYIRAAKRLSLHPIALSADPAQYDYLVAEGVEAIRIDTDDLDALIRECTRLRATYDIAGITSSAESFYATVGKLCRHFDLPGPNPESVERCCDKFAQRQLLAEAGVPVPAFRLAVNAWDVESCAVEIGLPVILKPAVGSGSRGVRLCRNVDEVAEHTTYLLGGKHKWGSSPRILVEEFAYGPLYVAHIMGYEIIGIESSEFGCPPHFVCRGGIFPALLSNEVHARITGVSLSCLRALGLGWGPTNIELRWTEYGPVVIEVNPRLGGGPQHIQLACGIDLITEHINLTIGDEWNLRGSHSRIAGWRSILPDRDGTLDWIDGEHRAAAVPGITEVKLHVGPKTPIVRKGDIQDSLGYVIAFSRSHPGTEAALQRAIDLIDWSISPSTVDE